MKKITIIFSILMLLFVNQSFSQKNDCEKVSEGKARPFYYAGSITQEAINQASVYDVLVQVGNMSNLTAKMISINDNKAVLIGKPNFKEGKVDLEDPEFYKNILGIALEENQSWKDKLTTGKEILLGNTVKINPKNNVKICETKMEEKRKYYNNFFSNFNISVFFNDNINKDIINITGSISPNEKAEMKDAAIEQLRKSFVDPQQGLATNIFSSKFGANVKAFPTITRSDEDYYHYIFDGTGSKSDEFHQVGFFSEADYYVVITLTQLDLKYDSDGYWNILDANFTFKWVDVAGNEAIATKSIHSLKKHKAKNLSKTSYLSLIHNLVDTDINPQVSGENITVGTDIKYDQFFPTFYKALAIETKSGFDVDIYIKSGRLNAPELDKLLQEMQNEYKQDGYEFHYQNTQSHKNISALFKIHLSSCTFDITKFQMRLLDKIKTAKSINLTNRAGPHYLIYLEEDAGGEITEPVIVKGTNNGRVAFELRPQRKHLDFNFSKKINVTMTTWGSQISISSDPIDTKNKKITVYTNDVLEPGNYKFRFDNEYEIEYTYGGSNNNNNNDDNNDNNNDNNNTYEHIDISVINPSNNSTISKSSIPLTVSCAEKIKKVDFDIALANGNLGSVYDHDRGWSETESIYFNEGEGRYRIDITVTTETGKIGKSSIYINYEDREGKQYDDGDNK